MDDKVSVDVVASFENGASGDAVLKLKDGTTCRLDRNDRRFPVWVRIVQKKQSAGAPVYVVCASGTEKAKTLLSPILRQVESLKPQADRIDVQFLMSPSLYALRATRPGYAQMKQTLEAAVQSHQPVLVTEDVREAEILDVRQPPAGVKMPVI